MPRHPRAARADAHEKPYGPVAWTGVPGSYADVVLAPAASVVRVPDGLDDLTAAAMLQGMTAPVRI